MTPALGKRILTVVGNTVEKLFNMLLDQPERFDWSFVPCSMLGMLEVALADSQDEQPFGTLRPLPAEQRLLPLSAVSRIQPIAASSTAFRSFGG